MAEILPLSEAIAGLVHDGDAVALEGFTHLIPFAAGHEVLRQGRTDLELIRMTPDVLYDQMIGLGAARKLVFSYAGNPGVGSLHRLRDAVEHGWPAPLEIEEHSHAGMANRFAAGASGLPCALMRGNVARMPVLLAGLATSVPGTTVNRLCGSSLDAAMQASRMIESGDARCVVVGRVESMSRAPGVLLKAEKPYAMGDQTLHSTTLGWRMVNPRMPEQWTISLHENLRRDTSLEKLEALKPAFVKDGTETAGNASPPTDGAGAALIGDGSVPGEPLARIVGRAVHAVDPDIFGIAPVEAANGALARAAIGWDEVEVVELNEAFAAQTLACLGEWTELDPDRLNVNGDAIAIGHPLGASGVWVLAGLAHELRRRGGGYGLAAICIGVGQGLAVVLHA